MLCFNCCCWSDFFLLSLLLRDWHINFKSKQRLTFDFTYHIRASLFIYSLPFICDNRILQLMSCERCMCVFECVLKLKTFHYAVVEKNRIWLEKWLTLYRLMKFVLWSSTAETLSRHVTIRSSLCHPLWVWSSGRIKENVKKRPLIW